MTADEASLTGLNEPRPQIMAAGEVGGGAGGGGWRPESDTDETKSSGRGKQRRCSRTKAPKQNHTVYGSDEPLRHFLAKLRSETKGGKKKMQNTKVLLGCC